MQKPLNHHHKNDNTPKDKETSMVGSWDVYLDWKNSGEFAKVKVTFMEGDELYYVAPMLPGPNPMPKTTIGRWAQRNGMVIWGFNTEETRFAGNLCGHAASGIMCTFSGLYSSGTWYATRSKEN